MTAGSYTALILGIGAVLFKSGSSPECTISIISRCIRLFKKTYSTGLPKKDAPVCMPTSTSVCLYNRRKDNFKHSRVSKSAIINMAPGTNSRDVKD